MLEPFVFQTPESETLVNMITPYSPRGEALPFTRRFTSVEGMLLTEAQQIFNSRGWWHARMHGHDQREVKN